LDVMGISEGKSTSTVGIIRGGGGGGLLLGGGGGFFLWIGVWLCGGVGCVFGGGGWGGGFTTRRKGLGCQNLTWEVLGDEEQLKVERDGSLKPGPRDGGVRLQVPVGMMVTVWGAGKAEETTGHAKFSQRGECAEGEQRDPNNAEGNIQRRGWPLNAVLRKRGTLRVRPEILIQETRNAGKVGSKKNWTTVTMQGEAK